MDRMLTRVLRNRRLYNKGLVEVGVGNGHGELGFAADVEHAAASPAVSSSSTSAFPDTDRRRIRLSFLPIHMSVNRPS